MPTVIRTGILHNPEFDDDASHAVRSLLGAVHGRTRGKPGGPRFVVTQETYVADDPNWIEDILCRWCDEEELDFVLTIGGTLPAPGPSRAQRIPDVTRAVLDRLLPGLPEAMRAHAGEWTDLALLDRGVAGIRSLTVIVNLPQGAAAAVCFLEAVLHLIEPALAQIRGETGAPNLNAQFTAAGEAEQVAGDGEGEADAGSGRLEAEEFAEFLRRRKQDEPE